MASTSASPSRSCRSSTEPTSGEQRARGADRRSEGALVGTTRTAPSVRRGDGRRAGRARRVRTATDRSGVSGRRRAHDLGSRRGRRGRRRQRRWTGRFDGSRRGPRRARASGRAGGLPHRATRRAWRTARSRPPGGRRGCGRWTGRPRMDHGRSVGIHVPHRHAEGRGRAGPDEGGLRLVAHLHVDPHAPDLVRTHQAGTEDDRDHDHPHDRDDNHRIAA